MTFTFHCPVRWSDMDVYGHVNNTRFLTLYEEARVALMFVGARQEGVTSLEDGLVIRRHEVDYLRPVNYDDPVRIELWLADVMAAQFVVAYELYAGDELASRARTWCVPVDPATGRPRRLTAAEREFCAKWQA
jgi:acyl-CoA thioester hydrolase